MMNKFNITRGLIIKLLIVIITITGLSITLYIAIQNNRYHPNIREKYDASEFTFGNSGLLINKDYIAASNDNFELHVDETTSQIYVLDKETETKWYSNPQEVDKFPKIKRSIKDEQKATLKIWYGEKLSHEKDISNYEYSIEEGNFGIHYIDFGFEVLYRIGDMNVVYTDIPQVLSKDRMEELVFNHISSLDKRIIEGTYSYNLENELYILKNKENVSNGMLEKLYNIFFESGQYTKEELDYDNSVNGVQVTDIRVEFEVGIRYLLTENGLEVELVNEMIWEKSSFPLVQIDVLPYFGTASTDDEGYILLPDGSGALMDLNNGKTYAKAYEKRLYGEDLSKSIYKKPEEVYQAYLPVFGMNKNNQGFVSIISNGVSMASVISDVSEKYDSYNKVYTKFHYREKDEMTLLGLDYKLINWTSDMNTSDYKIEYRFLDENSHDYNGMAKEVSNYYEDLGFESQDTTDDPVLNITLLGGYQAREYFLGIPYTKTKALTTTDEAKQLINELRNNGINNINIIYSGWANGGLFQTNPETLNNESAVGTKKELKELESFTESLDISLYPDVAFNVVYSKKNFKVNSYSTRLSSGNIAKIYPFNQATLLPETYSMASYALMPTRYEKSMNNLLSSYSKYDFDSLLLSDYAMKINGSYKRSNLIYRDESLELLLANMDKINSSVENIMFKGPNLDFAFYADNIIDIPMESSTYFIIDHEIPFYQLVLAGKVDYAGLSTNFDEMHSLNWHKLKMIETGSNLNFTWSYKDTYSLMLSEYNMYYSTYYKNWYDEAVAMTKELSNLDIYSGTLIKHEIIDDDVVKVVYDNGIEIYINYRVSDYIFDDLTIPSLEYVVRGGVS